MKRKITSLFLLLSFFSVGNSNAQTWKEIATTISQEPDFFFKENVEYSIMTFDSVYYHFISKPFDLGGMFTQQYTLPVLKNYSNEVEVEVLYYFDSTSIIDGQVIFHNEKDIEEIKVQLSIKELCETNQFFDYLLLRGQKSKSYPWNEIAILVGLNPSQIEEFMSNKAIDSLLLDSYHKAEAFLKRNKDFLKYIDVHTHFYEKNGKCVIGEWAFDLRYQRKD